MSVSLTSARRKRSPYRRDTIILERVLAWYAEKVYGRTEGPGCLPYYCDSSKVGAFAVRPSDLARGNEGALHRVLVTMAMYQSRRDVDITRIQREMPRHDVSAIAGRTRVRLLVAGNSCPHLGAAAQFDTACSVRLGAEPRTATCQARPRAQCHAKNATIAIRRMGDMGKIATSVALHLQEAGGFSGLIRRATETHASAASAADALVVSVSAMHRIGVKLATMFVSSLSTPALAPGLTPWAPQLDGSHQVVVDANVRRVVDKLRPHGLGSYEASVGWLRAATEAIDLRRFDPRWPRQSARLVQQALYRFASASNRRAMRDDCATYSCSRCIHELCPFADRSAHPGRAPTTSRRTGDRPCQ